MNEQYRQALEDEFVAESALGGAALAYARAYHDGSESDLAGAFVDLRRAAVGYYRVSDRRLELEHLNDENR